jgi:hypothetical protein
MARPAGKKVRAGFHPALEHESNAQHEGEVHQHDDPIDKGQAHKVKSSRLPQLTPRPCRVTTDEEPISTTH